MIVFQLASGLIGLVIAGLYCLFLLSVLFPDAYRAIVAWGRDVWDSFDSVWERRRWLAEWNRKLDWGPA